MPHDEFIKWQLYLDARPVDWRDDLRIYKILAGLGLKAKEEETFESLARVSKYNKKINEQNAFFAALKSSSMFRLLQSAQGGDKVPILES